MKVLTIAFTMLLCCCVFSDSFSQAAAPYKAGYSSNFKLGKATYSSMILDLWKDWDDNQFSRHDYFADTVKMWFSNGDSAMGKAAAMEGAVKFRGAMTSAKSTLHAWVPLYSNDKKEDLVCIWGNEVDTYADGKTETRELHEVWWFNKDGKVVGLRQWAAKW